MKTGQLILGSDRHTGLNRKWIRLEQIAPAVVSDTTKNRELEYKLKNNI